MGELQNKRIEREEIVVVYLDLGEKLGFYRVRPGLPPYICLNVDLLEGSSHDLHHNVFNTLFKYHNSIPPDSPYRLFEHVRYFRELLPPPAPMPTLMPVIPGERGPEAEQEELPEIIFLGRFRSSHGRVWLRSELYQDKFRLVGG